MLSDSDSESKSNDVQLTINEHYAKAYAAKKEREELSKLKDKYGSDADEDGDSEDSEDAESEDEDGEELTPAVDAAILRTLARIKRKDPDIYDRNSSIFEQEQQRIGHGAPRAKISRDNVKLLTIKQHALSSMLNPTSRSPSPKPQITHEQEQSALRSETISAFHNAVNDDAEGEGAEDLLVLREKTKDEIAREEEEYKAFLEREVGEDIKGLVSVDEESGGLRFTEQVENDDGDKEAAPKGKKKRRRKDNEAERQGTDQEFLMSYILNRGWIDRSSKRIPTYNEIMHRERQETSADQHGEIGDNNPDALVDEDDEFEDIADRFESSYNFRFEEPDAAIIPTHPRDISSTVRRQDTTRKEARQRRKQRKAEEMLKKREEIKRMKALKMKELRQKLEKIEREGGVTIDTEAFADFDLEGDWDPGKHDKQMSGIYDEEDDIDEEKPQWADDIDITDILPNAVAGPSNTKPKKKKKKKDDDNDVADGVDVDAMDADIEAGGQQQDEEWDGTEEMRKLKVQEYMDEVYGMDFNDMVGDMPTRFKYATVASQSYALTPVEILLATDPELNDYMGIKKYAPYRKESKWDGKRAGKLQEFRKKLKERSWASGKTGVDGEIKKIKKRKGKKERQRAKVGGIEQGDAEIEDREPQKKPH